MPKDGLQTIYENTAFYGSSTAEANDPAVCCVGSKQSRWLCGDHNRPESEECQVYMYTYLILFIPHTPGGLRLGSG